MLTILEEFNDPVLLAAAGTTAAVAIWMLQTDI